MTNAVTSVIVASSSAVAKVFVIGAIGYVSAIRPKANPILPPHAINAISKMNFNLLIIPLVYTTISTAVTPEQLGSLWFILVAAIGVIVLSYAVATLLGKLPFFHVENKIDFDALRVASAFPNIVALPILIFPTLCEFPVVHNSFYEGGANGSTEADKYRSCVDRSNAMIFIYFFAWNLLYWILGYPTLVAAGQKRQLSNDEDSLSTTDPHLTVESFKSEVEVPEVINEQEQRSSGCELQDGEEDDHRVVEENAPPPDENIQPTSDVREGINHLLHLFANALLQTIKTPGFIAMVLGFITACIAPLRDALFSAGGALRWVGSALESLGKASASVGTLVVAASLVHQAKDDETTVVDGSNNNSQEASCANECDATELGMQSTQQRMSDLRASMRRRRSSISQLSSKAIAAISLRKPTIRMHSWFITSRLLVAPAIVCLVIIAMDCGGALGGIPNLAKMIVIVNAGLPGAQTIVLTLKSKGLSDSASIVAKVYLPSYLLSVVTIAAWTSLGLIISVPRDDGTSFCNR